MTNGDKIKLRAELASLAEKDEYLSNNQEIVHEMMGIIGSMDDETADALMKELGLDGE